MAGTVRKDEGSVHRSQIMGDVQIETFAGRNEMFKDAISPLDYGELYPSGRSAQDSHLTDTFIRKGTITEQNAAKFRAVGLGELEPFKAIVDALRGATMTRRATKKVPTDVALPNGKVVSIMTWVVTYEEVPDHDMRLKAARLINNMVGSDPGARLNVTTTGIVEHDHKHTIESIYKTAMNAPNEDAALQLYIEAKESARTRQFAATVPPVQDEVVDAEYKETTNDH